MKVFTKTNAIVGYATIKAATRTLEKKAEKARKKRAKKRSKLVPYLVLGIVSFGVAAAIVAFALKKRGAETAPDGGERAESPTADEATDLVAEEAMPAAAEPVPAT